MDGSSWTEVRRTFDESPTYVECVELIRHCGNGGRWRYTVAPRNAATMAGNDVARNVVAALAGNALHLAAFLQRYCSNTLDLATLLQWPATRRCYDNALDLGTLLQWPATRRCCGNALDLAAMLRWPATHWTSQRCCDVRQCATISANVAL